MACVQLSLLFLFQCYMRCKLARLVMLPYEKSRMESRDLSKISLNFHVHIEKAICKLEKTIWSLTDGLLLSMRQLRRLLVCESGNVFKTRSLVCFRSSLISHCDVRQLFFLPTKLITWWAFSFFALSEIRAETWGIPRKEMRFRMHVTFESTKPGHNYKVTVKSSLVNFNCDTW